MYSLKMSRPSTITVEQILGAAREVFLERGIEGTTAEVARRAGIAEGSIFKRFKTKHELFRHAMEIKLREPEALRQLLEQAGKGDVRQNLYQFSSAMLAFLRRLVPLMVMSWSNRGAGFPKHLASPASPPRKALEMLTGYFAAEIKLGRIRPQSPEILARQLMGSIQNFVFFEMIIGHHDEMPIPEAVYVQGVVDLLWNGVAPIQEGKP
jgi:AcrR family transcriptional regulator